MDIALFGGIPPTKGTSGSYRFLRPYNSCTSTFATHGTNTHLLQSLGLLAVHELLAGDEYLERVS